MKKVAVTGGIASGKTTVCLIFQKLGAYFVSADQVVHQLLSPHTTQGKQVIALLGDEIVVQGEIDRKKIAEKVFSNPVLLGQLEKILHPAVKAVFEKEYKQAALLGTYPLFVAEVPLLFEAGWDKAFDATIAVVADPHLSEERFNGSSKQFLERQAQQHPIEEKKKLATFVIVNNGSLEELKLRASALYLELLP